MLKLKTHSGFHDLFLSQHSHQNLELFSERTSFVLRNAKLKDHASLFSFSVGSPCMKSAPGTNRREEEHSWYQ
jgi:hypothetical protein